MTYLTFAQLMVMPSLGEYFKAQCGDNDIIKNITECDATGFKMLLVGAKLQPAACLVKANVKLTATASSTIECICSWAVVDALHHVKDLRELTLFFGVVGLVETATAQRFFETQQHVKRGADIFDKDKLDGAKNCLQAVQISLDDKISIATFCNKMVQVHRSRMQAAGQKHDRVDDDDDLMLAPANSAQKTNNAAQQQQQLQVANPFAATAVVPPAPTAADLFKDQKLKFSQSELRQLRTAAVNAVMTAREVSTLSDDASDVQVAFANYADDGQHVLLFGQVVLPPKRSRKYWTVSIGVTQWPAQVFPMPKGEKVNPKGKGAAAQAAAREAQEGADRNAQDQVQGEVMRKFEELFAAAYSTK